MENCKEYLVKNIHGEYVMVDRHSGFDVSELIEIPEGAECAILVSDNTIYFWKSNLFIGGIRENWVDMGTGYDANWYLNTVNGSKIIWQRATHPEELPFVDDEPKYTDDEVRYMDENGQGRLQSINDQYAEIEQVRQATKDNVNHPSHYTQGKVECIDALESATIGKSGIEAVCVSNIIKYLWRYEEKNGLEDVKKSQFYLNRLLATLEINNG